MLQKDGHAIVRVILEVAVEVQVSVAGAAVLGSFLE